MPTTETRPGAAPPRHLLVSGDDHAGPPLPGFAPYFDPEHRDDFDRYWRARPSAPLAEAAARGDRDALAGFLEAFMRATGGSPAQSRAFAERALEATLGLFDSDVRKAHLDAEGIVGEVIFGDGFVENQPPFSDIMEGNGQLFGGKPWPFDLQLAGARAYNRWLAEFCAEDPIRRAGVIQLPAAHDVPALVAETKRAREAGLRGGVLVPPLEPGLPGYHDPHYDPLWAVAADLGLPVSVHGGNARAPDGPDAYGASEPLASFFHFTESTFFDRRPLWFFMWGGVFDRHPKLRLVFAEALAHWVPQELLRLDEMVDMWNARALRERLSKRPSEYWREHCAITATFASRGEIELRHAIGLDNLLWGSDFPHPEGTWPITPTCLRHAFHDVPADESARMLGLNALRLYDFDEKALRTHADQIGPLATDVIQPPTAPPSDYVGMGLR
ncbi:MAG: amidohydrolase [Spirochaetaceae bacterium]|nr:amidohydrolase [Myxococcales bacterium]MCB9724874.1 amidohydrolase [Spirochaetaceae bacterium]